MLLRSHAGERLEPVGKMGGAVLNGPVLHGVGYYIRNAGIQLRTILNGLFQFFVHTLWQAVSHHSVIEYVLAKHL